MYAKREVLFALPKTKMPKAGYPVVLFFQGIFFPMEFKRSKSFPFGGYNEILGIKSLLDAGFAIVAPIAGAGLFWQSNLNPIKYDLSSEKFLVKKILSEIEKETFGKLNIKNLFAFGISNGRYARCGGPYCPLPNYISPEHPPMLFMHGQRDIVVPIGAMKKLLISG